MQLNIIACFSIRKQEFKLFLFILWAHVQKTMHKIIFQKKKNFIIYIYLKLIMNTYFILMLKFSKSISSYYILKCYILDSYNLKIFVVYIGFCISLCIVFDNNIYFLSNNFCVIFSY